MNDSDTKKLLILDDSEDLVFILKIYFEKKGYVVESLMDGNQVYPIIESFKPDILLMDVLLNGTDGRTICQLLRNHPETKNLGILLTSASPNNLKDYKKCRADDCIEKPFDLGLLNEKITSMLSWLPIRQKAFQQITPA